MRSITSLGLVSRQLVKPSYCNVMRTGLSPSSFQRSQRQQLPQLQQSRLYSIEHEPITPQEKHRSFYSKLAPSMVFALALASITYLGLELIQNYLDGHFKTKELGQRVEKLEQELQQLQRGEQGNQEKKKSGRWWIF